MKLSIIIVNYNTRQLIDKCLEAIEQFIDKQEVEVIVVDNASSDGSVDLIKNKYPFLQIFFSDNT